MRAAHEAPRWLAGVRLAATDLEWSSGAGAEVTGPAGELLMALTGRRVGLKALAGPGRDLLSW